MDFQHSGMSAAILSAHSKGNRFFALFAVLFAGLASLLAQDQPKPSKWEPAIQKFEAADKTNPPPQHAILFIGSSSIVKWKTLAQDFPDRPVINRGFGGSQIADSVAFANRIVIPYRPRLVVLYAGDNDIAAKKTPEQLLADFKAFTLDVQGQLPETRIAFIAIKPSLKRLALMDQIKGANRYISEFCRTRERLVYIDVFTPMLGEDGKPPADLFVQDGLHLSPKGYELWTQIVRPYLD